MSATVLENTTWRTTPPDSMAFFVLFLRVKILFGFLLGYKCTY